MPSKRRIDRLQRCVAVQSLDESDAYEETIDALKAMRNSRRLSFLS